MRHIFDHRILSLKHSSIAKQMHYSKSKKAAKQSKLKKINSSWILKGVARWLNKFFSGFHKLLKFYFRGDFSLSVKFSKLKSMSKCHSFTFENRWITFSVVEHPFNIRELHKISWPHLNFCTIVCFVTKKTLTIAPLAARVQ